MSQTTSSKPGNTIPREELDAWIHGEPPFDEDCRQLLIAYRAAVLSANDQEKKQESLDRPNPESSGDDTYPRRVPSVPRLSDVDGLDVERLSRSHGRLIAIGLLRENLDGVAGLTYRLTSEAAGRLAQEETGEAVPGGR